LAVWPGQAELAGEGDERALVVLLAAPRGVLDPADVGQGVDGLVQDGLQGLAGAFGQALAGATNSSGYVGSRTGPGRRPGLVRGAALDPVVGAEVAPCSVDVQGA
jgi:hypothetical protein